MRSNRVKQKLQTGEIANGLSSHSISSDSIDFWGQLGFDGFWIEGEHGSVTQDQVGDIDLFFVAPSDLAQSMGLIGQPYHPEVQSAVRHAIQQITAGHVVGTIGMEAVIETHIQADVRLFMISYDAWIKTGASQYLAKVAALK